MPETRRIVIDPNRRVKNNWTASDLIDDVRGKPVTEADIGRHVIVIEPESRSIGVGHIRELSVEHRLVYVEVEWQRLRRSRRFEQQYFDVPVGRRG